MKKAIPTDNKLMVTQTEGTTTERALADVALDPLAGAAALSISLSKPLFGPTDLTETYLALSERAKDVRRNKLASAEDMLTAQAATLNAIFVELVRRSAANMGQYIEAADRYMRLALKAQGQCRATLETLAAIKNPPVVYARQANISAGPQQVNNGTGSIAGAEKHENAPNELLETDHGSRLDSGTASTSGGGHSTMGTLDTLDGTENVGREMPIVPQRL